MFSKGKELADKAAQKLLHKKKQKTQIVDLKDDAVGNEAKSDDGSSSSWGHRSIGPVKNRELAICNNLVNNLKSSRLQNNENDRKNSEVQSPRHPSSEVSIARSKPLPIPAPRHHALSFDLPENLEHNTQNELRIPLAAQRQRMTADANKRCAISSGNKSQTKTEVQDFTTIVLEEENSKDNNEKSAVLLSTEVEMEDGDVSLNKDELDTNDIVLKDVELNITGVPKAKSSSWASFFCCCCKTEEKVEDESSRLIASSNRSIQNI